MKVIKGYGVPDAETIGEINDFYVDLDTNDVYRCTITNTIGEEWGGVTLYARGLDNVVYVWEAMTGGGASGGELTDIGVELYVIYNGMKGKYTDILAARYGSDIELTRAEYDGFNMIVVRDSLPYMNFTGPDDLDNFRNMMCVLRDSGCVYVWNKEDKRWDEAFSGSITMRGWIDKSSFDELDLTDEKNQGLYVIASTARYPMVDRTLIDLKSDSEIIDGFFRHYKLLNTVDIPNARVLCEYVFSNCRSLTSINFPSVVLIHSNAFSGCNGLTSVNLPKTLKSINSSAFENCTSLAEIMYDGTIEQWNAIEFGASWCKDIPATEVICSDGTVSLV